MLRVRARCASKVLQSILTLSFSIFLVEPSLFVTCVVTDKDSRSVRSRSHQTGHINPDNQIHARKLKIALP